MEPDTTTQMTTDAATDTMAQRCALLAVDDEPLGGTSPEAARWVLVEDPGPWGRDGLADGHLPAAVRGHLIAQTAIHDVRHQALRRVDRARSALRTVMLVNIPDGWAATTAMAVEDLVDLDVALVTGPAVPTGWEPVTHPVVAVCTHAKRDACCALWGRPVAAALDAALPGAVWETSHTGGHRFAASVLTFPDGGVHGRVDDTAGFAVDVIADRIPLSSYRGNASLPRPAQAAEVAIRRNFDLTGHTDVTIGSCEVDGAVATVRVMRPGRTHEVTVERGSLPPRPTSCGGEPKDPRPWQVTTIDGAPATGH